MLRKKLALSLVCLLVFNMMFSFNLGISFAAKKNDELSVNLEEQKNERMEDKQERKGGRKEEKEEQKHERKEVVEEKKSGRTEEQKNLETSPKAQKLEKQEKTEDPEIKNNLKSEIIEDLVTPLNGFEILENHISDDEINSLNLNFFKKLNIDEDDIIKGQYVVLLKNGKNKLVKEKDSNGVNALKKIKKLAIEEIMAEILKEEDAVSVRPLYKVSRAAVQPNDKYYTMYDIDAEPEPYNGLWGIFKTNGDENYKRADVVENLGNIKVAIVDSGIMASHEDLFGTVAATTNTFLDPEYTITEDDYGHGTHVAGTIGATSHNTVGVAGVASGVNFISAKVLDENGDGNDMSLAAGIDWAVANGADVINMSLGLSSDLENVRTAVQNADAAGVIMVAAVGNGNSRSLLYPAAYPEVIAVGAIDWDYVNDELKEAWFSNASNPEVADDEVDVVAPGMHIISTYLNPTYEYMNGTSMATPHVTGLVALIKAGNGSATLETIREIINGTAQTSGLPDTVTYPSGATVSEKYGNGIIDYSLAIDAVLGENLLTKVEVDSIAMTEVTTSTYKIAVDLNTEEVILEPFTSDATKLIEMKLLPDEEYSAPFNPIVLGTDVTEIMIKATAYGGAEKEHTITINKESSNADLSGLEVILPVGTITTPSFTTDNLSYTAIVSGVNEVTVRATKSDDKATIKINGIDYTSGADVVISNLKDGENIVDILVTSEIGITKNYELTIYKKSSENKLSSITLSDGILLPSFNSTTNNYTVDVLYAIDNINIEVVRISEMSSVTINSIETISHNMDLEVGVNVCEILVVAEDDDTGLNGNTYTLTINRAEPSNDSSLLDLFLSEGTLTPEFTSGTFTYGLLEDHVLNKTLTVITTKSHNGAIVEYYQDGVLKGSGESLDINLVDGLNSIVVKVIAEDGSSTEYTFEINKASSNADLTSLVIMEPNGSSVVPVFNPDTLNYTLTVSLIDEVTFMVSKADPEATILINGGSYVSDSSKTVTGIQEGDTVINILVTAQDTSTKNYEMTIHKQMSENRLSSIALNNGILSPSFNSSILNYSVNVAYTTEEIAIDAVRMDTLSDVIINGTNTQHLVMDLAVGENTCEILVIAENGLPNTYNVLIIREEEYLPPDPPTTPPTGGGGGGGGGGGFIEPEDEVDTNDNGDTTVTISIERIEGLMKGSGSKVLMEVEGDVRSGTVSVNISKEIINLLLSQGKGLEIKINGLIVEIEYELLNSFGLSKDLRLVSEKISDEDIGKILAHRPENTNPITQVYELRIKDGSNEINNFNSAVKYTLELDINLINNINNLILYYVNPTTGEYEEIKSIVTSNKLSFETNHNSKYVVLEPFVEIAVELIPEAGFSVTNEFSDINNHWAEERIKKLADAEIVMGVSETSFAPDTAVTRAEFTAYVTRMLDLPVSYLSEKFIDVKNTDWFYNSVMSAYEAGIVLGVNDYEFKPNDNITREEMATMLIKAYLYKMNVDINTIVMTQEIRFVDQNQISSWALQYVLVANSKGYIVGDPSKKFRPSDNATRAEAAVVVWSFMYDNN